MKEQVEQALDMIRPALQNDGGDIELVGVDEATGVVSVKPVSYTHLRAHETVLDLVCRLLLEKKKLTLHHKCFTTYFPHA